jgi:hypothetical protein
MKNEGIIEKEFPNRLYVTHQNMSYPLQEITQMVGSGYLESQVRDDGKVQTVAVYELVRIEKYKKVVTRAETLEKV